MDGMQLKKVITAGNVQAVAALFDRVSSKELEIRLCNHVIDDLPVLHFLARFPFRESEQSALDKVIGTYVKSGYDVNKITDKYCARKRASLGFTALLAAIEQQNLVLVECLIRHGAQTDIRDKRGFSACHWSVIVGSLKCLEAIVNAGAVVDSTEQERNGDVPNVHPLLHTAVDEGRGEMVVYLLNKGLVNCNERAVYRGILSEKAFTHFPSRYNTLETESLETVDVSFTALGRAVRMRKILIIEYLLTVKDIKLSGLDELHFCIVEGDTEIAYLLQDYLSDEELRNDKIDDKWALHCLHPKAFMDEMRVEKTIELIRAYVDAGWDVNSVSASGFSKKVDFPETLAYEQVPTPDADSYHFYPFTDYTLLHLACFYHNLEIIKCLLDDGADINCKTGGDYKVFLPLQILLLSKQFDTAVYLIERGADLMTVGQLKMYLGPSKFLQTFDTSTSEGGAYHFVTFTSLELLLRMPYPNGLGTLNAMLKKNVALQGPKEFHLAIQGGCPAFVLKLLQHCVKNLDAKDLNSMGTVLMCDPTGYEVPTFIWLMITILRMENDSFDQSHVGTLVDIMKLMVEYGYDCNLRFVVENADKNHIIKTGIPVSRSDPLIFFIVFMDFRYEAANVLLETLLKFEHVQSNVKNAKGLNPVELVLQLYNRRCMNSLSRTLSRKNCWNVRFETSDVNYCHEAVKLLVNHGVDVSEMVIDAKFKYHYGYKPMLQLLYCAGAKIDSTFFTSQPVCHAGYFGTRSFTKEIKELEEWTKQFDKQCRLTLKYISGLMVRKNLKTIADVKKLETELPTEVMNEVLDMIYI